MSERETIADRYELGPRLAEGATCSVHGARDRHLGCDVVVKLVDRLPDGQHDRFQREVTALSRLRHPNNVRILDFGHAPRDGRQVPFVVLEYFPGRSLRSVLRHSRRLPPSRAVEITAGVLRALAEAHDNQVVHGDVKPENILLLRDCVAGDCVKLVDYGACSIERASAGAVRVRPGTPHYVAPEVIRGEPQTPASDVYAVGVMLYECVAGCRPFDGPDVQRVLRRVLHDAPTPLARMVPTSEALAAVVDRAMSKAPEARYSTALELQDALLGLDSADLERFELTGFAPIEGQGTLNTLESVVSEGDSAPVEGADGPELVTALRSNERPLVWFLDDDEVMQGPDIEALRIALEARYDVRLLDEDDRFIARWEIDKSRCARPWMVVFGRQHVLQADPLLMALGAWPDTAKVLCCTDRSVELVQAAIDGCGLDHLISLPDGLAALESHVDFVVARCRRMLQQYDCLRLALRDAREDRIRLEAGREGS